MQTVVANEEAAAATRFPAMHPMRKRAGVAAIALALLMGGAGVSYLLTRDSSSGSTKPASPTANQTDTAAKPSSPAATNPAAVIPPSFRHPAAWASQTLTAADQRAGLLLQLKNTQPEATAIVRRIGGQLANPLDLATVASTTQAALEQQVQGFALVGNEVLRAGNHDYIQISYAQKLKPTEFRSTLVVIPMANQTFYLTFRAASADYPKVEPDVKQMVDSFLSSL